MSYTPSRERTPEPDDSNLLYKTLLESTLAIPFRIDWATKQYTYIGPQIADLLGWSPQSWATVEEWAARIHPDERDEVVNRCVELSLAGVDHESDYRALTSDGGFVWVREVVHVTCDENGGPLALIGFVLDISERKKAEQLRDELDAQKLANERLQERLQVAHDLHDGLGGTLVHMMASVEQGGETLLRSQALSILKLIRDDLRQTIDSNSTAGVTVPATPQEWVAPLRRRFSTLLDELGVASDWRFARDWRTPPDALQYLALTRLIEEALTNVIKHSRAARVTLSLEQPEADELILRVEDDGVGFDVEATRQAGLGIGMRSMAVRIARVGGVLHVVSEPGRTVLTAQLQVSGR